MLGRRHRAQPPARQGRPLQHGEAAAQPPHCCTASRVPNSPALPRHGPAPRKLRPHKQEQQTDAEHETRLAWLAACRCGTAVAAHRRGGATANRRGRRHQYPTNTQLARAHLSRGVQYSSTLCRPLPWTACARRHSQQPRSCCMRRQGGTNVAKGVRACGHRHRAGTGAGGQAARVWWAAEKEAAGGSVRMPAPPARLRAPACIAPQRLFGPNKIILPAPETSIAKVDWGDISQGRCGCLAAGRGGHQQRRRCLLTGAGRGGQQQRRRCRRCRQALPQALMLRQRLMRGAARGGQRQMRQQERQEGFRGAAPPLAPLVRTSPFLGAPQRPRPSGDGRSPLAAGAGGRRESAWAARRTPWLPGLNAEVQERRSSRALGAAL